MTALRVFFLLCLMFCAPLLASADTISFIGNLADAQDVALTSFTLNNFSSVSLQTWSYGGGTNAMGTVIPGGGFAMELALYGPSPEQALLQWLSNGVDRGCPPGHSDLTDYCGDLAGNISLAAGTYTLAIFAQGSQAPLSLPNSFGTSGQFWNYQYGGDVTSVYAVDVSVLAVPEPSSLLLLASGAALLVRKLCRLLSRCDETR